MRKILITGADSYIGTSFERWIERYQNDYFIDTVDMRDNSWRERDFSLYDTVFHVAGIAHVSSDPRMKELYNKVNRDLTIETAMKAKSAGVKQFIFMSSIIIYGNCRHNKGFIEKNTVPNPSNFYGQSKLEAEEGIIKLECDNFKVAILRPPMIYGKGSKGNYSKLSKAARKLPAFPDIDNQRSMLYIDNLCEFIRLIILNGESGIFFPQNSEYVKTSEMVELIAKTYGKNIRLTKILNPLLRLLIYKVGVVNKLFGNMAYEKSLSEYRDNYRVRNLRESIMLTEK